MILQALVNGLEATTVSIADRAVLYGDSVFETVAVRDQKPLLLKEHLDRLSDGADALNIQYQREALINEINSLILKHDVSCVLRITVSRGEGGRGYQPDANMDGTRILSLHKLPERLQEQRLDGITLGLSSIKLSKQPHLAGHKHSNRIEQVLASMELTDEVDEIVMLDTDNRVICGSKSNIFALIDGQWITPKLSLSGIAGVMRGKLISLMNEQQISLSESDSLTTKDIEKAQAVFVSNSLVGIWPVKKYMNQTLNSMPYCQPVISLLEQSRCIL